MLVWVRRGCGHLCRSDRLRPMALTHLDVVELQANEFRSAKTTTEQHRQHCVIALSTHCVSPRMLEDFRTLLCGQTIARTEPELLDSFDAADSGSQFGT